MTDCARQISELERQGLRRRLSVWPGTGGTFRLEDGREMLNFSSNDYLDLARSPALKAAAVQAVERYGCSSSASRLMSGSLALHEDLERALARFAGQESALVFASGFSLNTGVIPALTGRGGIIFADRLCHASLVDGARLSSAALKRFAHNDAAALERMLAAAPGCSRKLIVCESVYSMDGDLAPLDSYRALAKQYGAILLADHAHAAGVLGMGAASRDAGAAGEVFVGTLGKALGSQGGFVACSASMRELLINRARSFIFSTALPPASAAAALAAVKCIEARPGMGAELLGRARFFHAQLLRQGLRLSPFASQIIPVQAGGNTKAVELAERLRARGLLVTAVRPPAVPAGTARLRLSVTLAHTEAGLEAAACQIAQAAREAGVP